MLEQYAPPTEDERARPRAPRRGQGRLRQAREGHHPQARSPSTRSAPTAAPRTRSAPIETEVDIAPRVHGSALFTRGETQILSSVALGHHPHGHEGRQPRPAGDQALLAPLQLPAVLGGRGRLHARPEAPRHRPRRARRAGAPADDPRRGGVPLRDPSRLRDARVQRLLVDGLGLRLLDGAAGRRRAGHPHRSPAWRWA